MHGTRTLGLARRLGLAAAGVGALMLLAAACGGNGSGGGGLYGSSPTTAGPTTAAGGSMAAVVDLRTTRLGKTLVDGQGRTLYLFEADKDGKSNCQGACQSAWPPYRSSGTPQAGSGVAGKLLGTIPGDGGAQVTYHGHPLYYYAGDARPGDTAGQGLDQFGAKWYVVAPSGDKIGGD